MLLGYNSGKTQGHAWVATSRYVALFRCCIMRVASAWRALRVSDANLLDGQRFTRKSYSCDSPMWYDARRECGIVVAALVGPRVAHTPGRGQTERGREMAHFDEAAVRLRLNNDLEQVQRDIYERTLGDQAISPSEGIDGTGVTSEQNDEGTALEENEANQAMVDNDRALERQIRAAIERLDMGKYGICERCGKEIPAQRLEALPYVTLCIEDQELAERGS